MSDESDIGVSTKINRRDLLSTAAALPVAAALAPQALLAQQRGRSRARHARSHSRRHHRRGRHRELDAPPGLAPHAGRRDRRGRQPLARIEPRSRRGIRHPARVRGLAATARGRRHRRRADRHVAVHAPRDHAGRARQRPTRALPGAHGEQRGRSARHAGRVAASSESRVPCSCRARAATASTARC